MEYTFAYADFDSGAMSLQVWAVEEDLTCGGMDANAAPSEPRFMIDSQGIESEWLVVVLDKHQDLPPRHATH